MAGKTDHVACRAVPDGIPHIISTNIASGMGDSMARAGNRVTDGVVSTRLAQCLNHRKYRFEVAGLASGSRAGSHTFGQIFAQVALTNRNGCSLALSEGFARTRIHLAFRRRLAQGQTESACSLSRRVARASARSSCVCARTVPATLPSHWPANTQCAAHLDAGTCRRSGVVPMHAPAGQLLPLPRSLLL